MYATVVIIHPEQCIIGNGIKITNRHTKNEYFKFLFFNVILIKSSTLMVIIIESTSAQTIWGSLINNIVNTSAKPTCHVKYLS